MARRRSKILTARELEVMNAVWKLGKGSIKEIRDEMGGASAGAYTSIATMLKFLESKGVVRHEQKGRSFFYAPKLGKDVEQRKALNYVLDGFFDGNAKVMIEAIEELTGVVAEEKPVNYQEQITAFHGS